MPLAPLRYLRIIWPDVNAKPAFASSRLAAVMALSQTDSKEVGLLWSIGTIPYLQRTVACLIYKADLYTAIDRLQTLHSACLQCSVQFGTVRC